MITASDLQYTAQRLAEQMAGVSPRISVITDPNDATRKVVVGLDNTEDGTRIRVLEDATQAFAELAPGPQRRTGSAKLTDEDSFIAYLKRWGGARTVIYADTAALGFTAVLDDHPEGDSATAWRQHRATYACPRSPEWTAWTAIDGKPMTQIQLADFVEARLEDLVTLKDGPSPLEVLAISRALTIKTKGTYQREINPTNGDRILVCKTETDTGSTIIPRAFAIAIPVFDGEAVRHHVEVRVRLEVVEGVPQFTLIMHRRKEVEREAFGEVRAKIEKETARPLLSGTP